MVIYLYRIKPHKKILLACCPVLVPEYSLGDLNNCGSSSRCRDCDVSEPVLRIQYSILTYLANPEAIQWGCWAGDELTEQQRLCFPLLPFSNPLSPSLLLTKKHPIWYQLSQFKSQAKERKNTFSSWSVCFLSGGMGASDQPVTRSSSLDGSSSCILY